MDKGYNGWTNYETWNAKLWIDNSQGDQEYWNERAMECLNELDGDKDEAASALAREMELSSDDNAPEVSGVYADLLNAALGRIDWYEIAQSIVDDVYDDWSEFNQADDTEGAE